MKTRKFTALLLVLCLLLTATPYSAPVRAVEEEHLAQEQAQTETQIETETAVEEAAPAPLAEGMFFRFVDQAVFQANGHVARVPEEETLSTYVFRNSDGTKTVYYLPDNVKYIAEDGAMVDKDLTLVSQSGGYGVARSDIQYLLPTSAASGIRMTHGNKQVTMYPQAPLGRATAATVSGDSVRYDNYFGSGIHLVYTPILSGLKEDIVLDSYTGTSSFSFTIDTNGMRLYNDEGQYYFAASADAEERMYLGDIIVYDAKGEPSAGTLTVTTVTMGQQYTLTVSADPAFLTDPDTVYPVTIDPTLTVSAATNSNFIEDASLYENVPNANAGGWQYNHCGYYNSTYGRCRTAVRLAGLKNDPVWQSIAYSSVVSAKFYIKEASGTAAVRITLHEMTNTTWTEANATWNTLANAYSTTVSGYASPASGQWAEFNFTGLAREWREVNATSDCSFMLVNTNYTLDKAFYSAEYGTTSYRPYVVITYNEDTIETDGLNYTSHVMDEGSTLRLFWPDVTSEVTWTSSNDSIARVDETGFVRGIRTGRATITASADGYAPQTCTVTVTIRDGIYYLRNNRSNYFLGVLNSGVSSGTTLRQEVKSTTEPTCFAQMWRITHLSGLNYVIRPVHKPNMALSASSTLLTVQNTDGMASIPESCKWQITYDQNGYVFTRGYYDMLPTGHSTALNATVAMGTSNVSGSHLWSFILTDSFDDQVLLYDKRTSSYSNNIVRYVAPGETLTLSQLGIDAAFVSEDTIQQDLVWTSGNSNRVSVNQSTGAITGITPNTTTTITVRLRNSTYSKSYTIHVATIPEGTYYIRNKSTGRYVEIQDQSMNNGTPIVQWDYHNGNSEKWTFTHLGDGTYSIRSANTTTAFYLGVAQNATADNAPVILRTGAIENEMKWVITLSASGAYYLTLLTGQDDELLFSPDLDNFDVSNCNGLRLIMRYFEEGENDRGEWQFSSIINIGCSTDNYSLDLSCDSRSSSIYAITFYDTLLPSSFDSPGQIIHHSNVNLTNTASKNDFSVNGAISNDIDFMIYIGHGHKANSNKGNHLHHSCSASGSIVGNGNCEDEMYNAYTSEMNFGAPNSSLRWVWLYTCNFLTSTAQVKDSLVTDNQLREMMTGAHIVMGYGSQSFLCDPMAQAFAEYLRMGYPIIDAYFMAGNNGEAPYASDNHLQKILYVPQARYETIYSPSVHYEYDTTDVLIITNHIDDDYLA